MSCIFFDSVDTFMNLVCFQHVFQCYFGKLFVTWLNVVLNVLSYLLPIRVEIRLYVFSFQREALCKAMCSVVNIHQLTLLLFFFPEKANNLHWCIIPPLSWWRKVKIPHMYVQVLSHNTSWTAVCLWYVVITSFKMHKQSLKLQSHWIHVNPFTS